MCLTTAVGESASSPRSTVVSQGNRNLYHFLVADNISENSRQRRENVHRRRKADFRILYRLYFYRNIHNKHQTTLISDGFALGDTWLAYLRPLLSCHGVVCFSPGFKRMTLPLWSLLYVASPSQDAYAIENNKKKKENGLPPKSKNTTSRLVYAAICK